jgi:type II secretory pathway component PulF
MRSQLGSVVSSAIAHRYTPVASAPSPAPLEADADVDAAARAALPLDDLVVPFRCLADLVDAGVPLARAVPLLDGLVPSHVAEILPAIAADLRARRDLVTALSCAGVHLPPELATLVRRGERSGGIAAALRGVATRCGEASMTRTALRRAIGYPIPLMCAGVGLLVLFDSVELPRLASTLGQPGRSVPVTSTLALRTLDLAAELVLPLALATLLAALLWRAWRSTLDGRRRWHRFLLRVPMVGDLRRGAAGARLSASLSVLLAGGMPLNRAMRHAAAVTHDEEIIARWTRALADVEQGSALSGALVRHDVVSPLVRELVHEGEQRGQISLMLARAARVEHERVVQRVRRVMVRLRWTLIVGLAGPLLLLISALIQAMYEVRQLR